MKYFLRIFLLLLPLFISVSRGQTPHADSLATLLRTAEGSARLAIINDLANSLENTFPAQALAYARLGIPLAFELHDSVIAATLYASAGFSASELGEFKSAMNYAQSSLEIAKNINNKKRLASANSVLGIIYVYLGQYSRALEHHLEALRLREELGLVVPTIATLNNIGIVYHNIGNYEKAIFYYRRAYEMQSQTENKIPLIRFMTNIGFSEFKRGNFETAMALHKDALALAESLQFNTGTAYTLYNLGIMTAEKKQYDSALTFLHQALHHYEIVGKKYGIVEVLNALGSVYSAIGNYDRAVAYVNRAISLAEQESALAQLKESYFMLFTLFEKTGKESKAFHFFKLYSDIKDSLAEKNESKKIAEISIQFELLDKERQINQLKSEMTITNLKLEKEQYQSDIMYVSIGSLLVVVIILFWTIHTSRKSKKIVEQKNEDLARVNNDLAQTVEQVNVLNMRAKQDVIEKAELLHEVNHRVKNNLVSILGLLVSEKKHAAAANKKIVAKVMGSLEQRIDGMLAVHQLLSDTSWRAMNLSDLADHIVKMVIRSIASGKRIDVNIVKTTTEISPRQANNLALVFNELATNSVKYAFHDHAAPMISVTPAQTNGTITVEYRDNGPGFPEEVLAEKQFNTGLNLVRQLITESLHGTFSIDNQSGAVVRFSFSVEDPKRT